MRARNERGAWRPYALPDECDRILDAIDANTRVVAISAVSFAPGFTFAVAELGAECRRRGVLLLVDAAQAIGVADIDVAAWNGQTESSGKSEPRIYVRRVLELLTQDDIFTGLPLDTGAKRSDTVRYVACKGNLVGARPNQLRE